MPKHRETSKPNTARRIQFDKRQRAEGLRLAQALADAQTTYQEWATKAVQARGVDTDATSYSYDPISGIALLAPKQGQA